MNSITTYFGATETRENSSNAEDEIGIPQQASDDDLDRPPIEELINNARNGGPGLFTSWDDKVKALAAAYPLYVRLLEGDPNDLEAATRLENFLNRKRRPSRKNLALIAIEISAKPRDEAERKACSDYSCCFAWAKDRNIPPTQFAAQVSATTLQDMKRRVQASRAAGRVRAESGTAKRESGGGDRMETASRAAKMKISLIGGEEPIFITHEVSNAQYRGIASILNSCHPEAGLAEILDAVRQCLTTNEETFGHNDSREMPEADMLH